MDVKSRRETLQRFVKECGISPQELDELAVDERFWAEVDRRVVFARKIAALDRIEARGTREVKT